MKNPREPKLYDLPVEFTGGGSYQKIDTEANLKIKEALENINDFEERLIYYNDNIRSLSTYKMQPEIHFQWGYQDQQLKIYCCCLECRKKPDFNAEHEKIYLKLRDQEVKRMVLDIEKITTYKEKLQYLFNTKGYEYLKLFTVYSNVPYTSSVDLNKEMFFFMPVIDLTPVEHEEIVIYNGLVKAAFDKKYRIGIRFSDKYDCFDFEKESLRLNHTLIKSIAPLQLLEYCKSEIENYFHYDEGKFSKSKIVTRQSKIEDTLFARMVFGVDIVLNESKLNSHVLFRYYHISEVVKFYRFILVKIRAIKDPEKEAELIRMSQPPEIKIEFTIANQMEKELNIIYTIFTSQYAKYDSKNMFPYILNAEGRSGIDGRYINRLDIISNVKLMNFQKYKKHFTERYEGTNNPLLVQNQLLKIRGTALKARDYYNDKLTFENAIVREFEDQSFFLRNNFTKLNFEKREKLIEAHNAVVEISEYYTCYIYLGCDRSSCKGRIDGEFRYLASNYDLADYCHRIVEFADMFGGESKSAASLREGESKNSFFYFDSYFNEHRKVMRSRTDYLYKYKAHSVEYIQAMDLVETNIDEIAEKFKSEIRNKVVELETANKIKLYLEHIQRELNSIYEYLESKPETKELEHLRFHPSVVSVQNLIRDIAKTNNIVFTGTLTTQNSNGSFGKVISETGTEELVSDLKDSIQKYLQPYKQAFNNETDYIKAIELINTFFLGQPVKIKAAIFVKNGHVKKIAFALGEIWRSQRNQVITYEYLQFYKQAFTIFENHIIDKGNVFGNNLYKYSISIT